MNNAPTPEARVNEYLLARALQLSQCPVTNAATREMARDYVLLFAVPTNRSTS